MAQPIRVKRAVLPWIPHRRGTKMQKMTSRASQRASTHTKTHTDTHLTIYSKRDWFDPFYYFFLLHALFSHYFPHFPSSLPHIFSFSAVLTCLQALSVQNSSQGLLATESSGSSYSSLNGIRILSLLWIISGHTVQLSAWSNLGESEGKGQISVYMHYCPCLERSPDLFLCR